jgi:hypothetical protein
VAAARELTEREHVSPCSSRALTRHQSPGRNGLPPVLVHLVGSKPDRLIRNNHSSRQWIDPPWLLA